MTWTKLDDNWDDSARLEAAAEALGAHGDSAFALWVRAVTYCNRRLTDGVVPGPKLRAMTKHRRPKSVIDALVTAGALVLQEDDAFEVRDFLQWNETREVVEARRAAKRWSRANYENVFARDGAACRYCGDDSTRLSIDHVHPRCRGGGDEEANLVVACSRCNSRKGGRTPEEAGMAIRRLDS